ncbi:hypothetical protein D3C84_847780 [compost metagenome]
MLGEVHVDGHHAQRPVLHGETEGFTVDLALDRHDGLPGLGVVLGEVFLGVLDEQRIDVDHVLEDLFVVRAPAERDQGTGDDVDEAPGEFAEGRGIAFA